MDGQGLGHQVQVKSCQKNIGLAYSRVHSHCSGLVNNDAQ